MNFSRAPGTIIARRREVRSVVIPLDTPSEAVLGPDSSQDVAADTKSWVGLTLVDQTGTPVPNRPYRVIKPDGRVLEPEPVQGKPTLTMPHLEVGDFVELEHITAEAKPGGRFETAMVSDADGSRYHTSAIYEEVTEPERLVWTEGQSGMRVTITFTEAGRGRTEVRIHQTNVPAMFRRAEAQEGFLTSLDRFGAYVMTLAGQP